MEASTNNHFYSLPNELWLKFIQYAGNLRTISLVDKRLNTLVKVWLFDAVRALRQDAKLDREVQAEGELITQFKKLMIRVKKEGVALTCDQKDRVQSMDTEPHECFRLSRQVVSVRNTYEQSGLIEFVQDVAKQAHLTDQLDQNFVQEVEQYHTQPSIHVLPFASAQRACNSLLQHTQLSTLSSLLLNKDILIPNQINCLTFLQSLLISNNKWTQSLPAIDRLVSLNILDIHLLPNLEELPCLTNLSQLNHLTFRGLENVTRFPSCETLTNLQLMNLNLPAIDALPPCLINFNLLTNIELSAMSRVRFWPTITEMPQLEQLTITLCDLVEVPAGISRLTNLVQLDLGLNQITNLPDICGSFGRLSVLRISNNQISLLPPSFSMLTALQELACSSNQLTQIPNLTNCTNLQELSLKSNQIRSLPDYLTQLTQLRQANFKNNSLLESEIEAFKSHTVFKF